MASEKRLIDANALKEKAIRVSTVTGLGKKVHCYIKAVGTHEIDKAPTVDAVEVVRCKDCEHWNYKNGFCEVHSRIFEFGNAWDVFCENDFCSYGERKDNE